MHDGDGRAGRAQIGAGSAAGTAARLRDRVRGDLAHVRAHAAVALAAWAVAAGAVARAAPDPAALAGGVALATVLVLAALIDVAVRLIPDWLTGAGAAAALALGLALTPDELPVRLLAAAVAAGVLLVAALARPGDLGMGDVKLTAVLALYLGPAVALALLTGFLAAALAGLVVVIRGGGRAATLPLGPFLALGGGIALLAGDRVLAAYAASAGW